MQKRGFTLTELLVVVAILAILIMLALSMVGNKRDQADDAAAKTNLHRLKIAFEDYYADNGCYPPPEFFDDSTDCNSDHLRPYLNALPCDKNTGLPYVLETDDSGCTWFKLYAKLKASDSDPDATALCDPSGSSLGNYAVSSENVRPLVLCTEPSSSVTASSTPTPSPTPTPSYDPSNNYYYCSAINNCTTFNPTTHSCTPSYVNNANCDGTFPPCQTVGSCTPR